MASRHYTPADVGRSLRQRRKRLGLTQADLAKRAGLTQSRISAIESGGDARLSTVLKLLQELDTDLLLVPYRERILIEAALSPREEAPRALHGPWELDDDE